jgi:hypothetical protein
MSRFFFSLGDFKLSLSLFDFLRLLILTENLLMQIFVVLSSVYTISIAVDKLGCILVFDKGLSGGVALF